MDCLIVESKAKAISANIAMMKWARGYEHEFLMENSEDMLFKYEQTTKIEVIEDDQLKIVKKCKTVE